ncbi:MAG: class I SAM-dependent methyltransferase [Ostreibacterium sp.]
MRKTIHDSDVVYQLCLGENVFPDDIAFLSQFYTIKTDARWRLNQVNSVYQLSCPTENLVLTLDFCKGHYQHRNLSISKEPLLKAIKIKQKLPKRLIDTTPGLLKDSFMLASRGIFVVAIERNPLVYIMVKRALAKTNSNIDYHFGDATTLLSHYPTDLIYLDPMYPPKRKRAKVKKDMQILHYIVGRDDDAERLFLSARQENVRVVVKRPSDANYLAAEKPSFIAQANKRGATRFDIYLPKNS